MVKLLTNYCGSKKAQKLILFGTFGDLHWRSGDLYCIWDTDRVIRKVLDGYSTTTEVGFSRLWDSWVCENKIGRNLPSFCVPFTFTSSEPETRLCIGGKRRKKSAWVKKKNRWAKWADIFPIWSRFYPFSPNAEPGPRLMSSPLFRASPTIWQPAGTGYYWGDIRSQRELIESKLW